MDLRASGASSLSWRRERVTEPTFWASEIAAASSGETSTVTAFATTGLSASRSSLWSTPRTRTFCASTLVTALVWSIWRVTSTSTRSPGRTKPPTPATSLERTLMARMPLARTPERLALPPGVLTRGASTGSSATMARSATRAVGPEPINCAVSVNAPAGAVPGKWTTFRRAGSSTAPRAMGAAATTTGVPPEAGAAAPAAGVRPM